MKKLGLLGMSTLVLGLAACGNAEADTEASANGWPEEITIVQYPNENNPNTPSMHESFREHLETELGIEVNELTAQGSYATGIEAMASDEVDVMLVTPQSFNQAKEKADAELIATNSSDADYYSMFVTQADNAEINELADLEDSNFAFVDASSSSGYMYPKATLVHELGLDPAKIEQTDYFFENVIYSGSHDNSAIGVGMGDYEAAAITSSALGRLDQAGVVDKEDFKVIGRSPDIPNPSYVVRGNLPEDFKTAIQDAFLSFEDPEYFEALHNDAESSFVEIDDSYYAETIEVLDSLEMEAE